MTRIIAGILLVVTAAFANSHSYGGDIYFGGELTPQAGTSGTLQILINTLPENYTFMNGGIALALNSSTPGVIEFTGGNVINTDGRWAAAVVQLVTADQIGRIFGASVLTPGLPSGTAVLFAELDYDVIGPTGSSTSLTLELLEDGLYDGSINPPVGFDVSGSFTIHDGLITVVPEPACLTMIGLAAIGLLSRRSSGR
jgi:hypothetical protein